MKQDVLDHLYEGGFFSYLDIRFARFISGLDKKKGKRTISSSSYEQVSKTGAYLL
ncbi:hypothetical protein QUF70_00815 [Desulfobacterales bacterium HSG17]|nr:hypothetical protein [Desulfobacterales bacterium HSG17]